MATQPVDLASSSHKKNYELVLSAKQPTEELAQRLDHLIKNSLSCTQHLGFLLHRVNWFEPPFTSYPEKLFKIFRLYRACHKQSSRVIFNLVIEGFFSPQSHHPALECLLRLFGEAKDNSVLLTALRDNYPHKLCSQQIHSNYLGSLLRLAQTYPQYRTDFLEIAIENLAKFDTEVLSGDDCVHRPFPYDQSIVTTRESSGGSELALKLDGLLQQLIGYLEQHRDEPALLDELLLIFQNKVLPIKTTKNIQLLVFFLAEQNRRNVHAFVSFLLANIFENQQQQNWCRLFAQSNFYLFSYLLRSRALSSKTLLKTFLFLVQSLQEKVSLLDPKPIDERTDLKQLLQEREAALLILQTIIMVKLGSPSLDRPDTNEIFHHLLSACRPKLHFEFFLKYDILEKIQSAKPVRNVLRLKFSNKFLPSTLHRTGAILDPLMVLSLGVREGELSCKIWKGEEHGVRVEPGQKGETPISYCSQTVV